MAEDYGLRVVNHCYKTNISIAACLHWLATRKTGFIFEYSVDEEPLRLYLTKQSLKAVNGIIQVPDEPGLGVDLNEEIVSRYRV